MTDLLCGSWYCVQEAKIPAKLGPGNGILIPVLLVTLNKVVNPLGPDGLTCIEGLQPDHPYGLVRLRSL